jgi:hypothetical protein
MIRRALLSCMLLLMSFMFAGTAFAAGDPTLHEVYQVAEAGRVDHGSGCQAISPNVAPHRIKMEGPMR